MSVIQVFLPECSNDYVSEALRLLTRRCYAAGAHISGGGLGGEYGYGAYYENETFMMHPYCWCERDECPWCVGCDCPDSAWHHFVDDKEVSYQEYDKFFKSQVEAAHGNHQKWMKLAEAANARRSVRHDPECDFCLTGGIAAAKGGGPGKSAPNFLFKPTSATVHWYKYIGRSMEIEGVLPKGWLDLCLASLEAPNE